LQIYETVLGISAMLEFSVETDQNSMIFQLSMINQ